MSEEALKTLGIYANKEWPIFPVKLTWDREKQKYQKKPLIKDWPNQATCEPEQIHAWYTEFDGCGWGVVTGQRSGLIVVDADIKDGKNGIDEWDDILRNYGDTDCATLEQETISGGLQQVFSLPELPDGSRWAVGSSVEKLSPSIDVRSDGGFVVIPPTEGYEWHEDIASADIAEAPMWLLDELSKPSSLKPRAPAIPDENLEREIDRARLALKDIRKNPDNYQDWIDVGMALSQLGDAGLELWIDWSKSSDKFNLGECEQKWLGFDPEHGLTLASLHFWSDVVQAPTIQRELTQVGNAHRLLDRHGKDLLYSHPIRTWYIWDSKRWKTDRDQKILTLCENTVRAIKLEAAKEDDKNQAERIFRHWARSEYHRSLKDMRDIASAHVPIDVGSLDEDDWSINVNNGTLDLRTGELKPHRRDDLLTRLVPFDYKPLVRCPNWTKFLYMICDQDEELITYLQRAVGYTLTGSVSEQCFFFLYGTGQNGKTTFVSALANVLGDYGQKTNSDALLLDYKRGDPNAPKPTVARLRGMRYAFGSEIGADKKWNATTMKDLTGGDQIVARHLRQEPVQFDPKFKLWFYGNDKPRLEETDLGTWRRVRIVPFLIKIPDEIVRPLDEVLNSFDYESILAWAVEGCLDWQIEGLPMPEVVKYATGEYQTEQDIFTQWFLECVTLKPGAQIDKKEAFKSCKNWMDDNGHYFRKTKRYVTSQLKRKGLHAPYGDPKAPVLIGAFLNKKEISI